MAPISNSAPITLHGATQRFAEVWLVAAGADDEIGLVRNFLFRLNGFFAIIFAAPRFAL